MYGARVQKVRVLVLDRGVVPAAAAELHAVVGARLAARFELVEQRGRPEEEPRVAPVDVVLDDLGVEHADPHDRHSDDPVGGQGGLIVRPDPDGYMGAHVQPQERGRARGGDHFVGSGRVGPPSRGDRDAVLAGVLPVLAGDQLHLGEQDRAQTAGGCQRGRVERVGTGHAAHVRQPGDLADET